MNNNILVRNYLTKIIVKYTSLRAEDVTMDISFEELGINSFMMLEMVTEIECEWGIKLSKTIFFEYPNLKELSEYFEKNYEEFFNMPSEKLENDKKQFLIEEELL